jgi:serine/threonine protein kinase
MRKICQFDIKPHNIVMDEHLNIKIIDFSISLDYSNINSNNLIQLPLRGTSFYMAPEVIKKEIINIKELNKIDLYSFGVIIYILAFGKYPYELSYEDQYDYQKIYEKIFLNKIGINIENKKFSLCFYDFLTNLLEKDINKRISINEALNHYWIKGAKILQEEMMNLNNIDKFVQHLLCNHIKKFNDYKTQYA